MIGTTQMTPMVLTVWVRAALYARVSGDDRGKEGRNLQGQLEMGREYAYQKGYTVIAEITEDDRGASGYEIDLPGLNQVLEMARKGEFEVLIVRELDRLSRSLAKQLIVEEELKRYGVRVEYVIEAYEDTPEGRLNKHIRATIAEYEREKINQRMTRGKRLASKTGKILAAGMAPYGYKLVEVNGATQFEINEVEAKVVRQIFDWYAAGKSMHGIVKELNRLQIPRWIETRNEGYRITDVKRAGWSVTVISKMLANETYIGVWHYGKYDGRKKQANPRSHWIAVKVPAIITQEVWEAVQAKKEQNARFAKRNTKYEYLLQGRIRCVCGYSRYGCSHKYKYKGEVRNTYFYYQCGTRLDPDKNRRCKSPLFRANQVDTVVWRWIRSLFMDEDKLNQGFEDYKKSQEEKNIPILRQLEITNDLITQREQELENKLANLDAVCSKRAKMRIGKEITRIEQTLDKLDIQKTELEAHLKTVMLTPEQITDIKTFAAKVRRGLSQADEKFEARRTIIDLLSVKVVCDVEDGKKVLHVECYLGKDSYLLSNGPRLVAHRR